MKKKILKILIIIYFLILFSLVMNVFFNQGIYIKKYDLKFENLPEEFDNYKIVQLTDIHSIRTKEQIEQIVNKIELQNPDIIFIIGDLIDSGYYANQQSAKAEKKIPIIESLTIRFVQELTKISKVYYVYGNHEMMLLDDPENNEFKIAVEDAGVQILNNKIDYLYKEEEKIKLIGLQDPACLYKDEVYSKLEGSSSDKARAILEDLYVQDNSNEFTILLAHRPECFEVYASYNIDLVLSGHTHGGMLRLPFIRGIYAHPQGFFPDYSYGIYKNRNSTMVVGAGIGYSGNIHFRVYNLPEIEVINLIKGE